MLETIQMTDPTNEPSDEEMRKLLLPNPSPEQVVEALKSTFAKPGKDVKIIKTLESYDDKNFWVEIDGVSYLAKCHNGVESRDFIKLWKEESSHEKSVINMQTAIMNHLNASGTTTSQPQPSNYPGIPLPASIHELPVHSAAHSPCQLVVRLFSWVPGRTMDSVKMLPLESLADAGRFLGRLNQSLSKLETDKLTAAKRYHQWDGKNTQDLKGFVQYIDDPKRKSMVESVIASFQKDLIENKAAEKFPVSLIHADFNDANILLDDNCRVSGVIDFGDSVERTDRLTKVVGGLGVCTPCWTLHIDEQQQNPGLSTQNPSLSLLSPCGGVWRVLDLSVAMAYAMLTTYGKKNRGISAAAAFLRGYSSVCSLTEGERKHLVLLIACRLSCSVTLGAYSYKQAPENEYLLLHAKPGWDALELIWGTDSARREKMRSTIDRIFDQACSENVDPNDEVFDCSDLSFPDPGVADPFSDMRVVSETDAKRQRVS